jgi:hypothetical protein
MATALSFIVHTFPATPAHWDAFAIVEAANWKTPADVKKADPKANIPEQDEIGFVHLTCPPPLGGSYVLD